MEIWDLYTRDREKTGKTMIRGEKIPDGYYRIAVHACIFNDEGKMLIQQRQSTKRSWANMWDISAGGSVIAGETSQMGIVREVFEELGIKAPLENERPRLTVSFENGYNDIYVFKTDVKAEELTLQPTEVQAVKWATLDEVLKMIDDGTFIPYQKGIVEYMFFMCDNLGTHAGEGRLSSKGKQT